MNLAEWLNNYSESRVKTFELEIENKVFEAGEYESPYHDILIYCVGQPNPIWLKHFKEGELKTVFNINNEFWYVQTYITQKMYDDFKKEAPDRCEKAHPFGPNFLLGKIKQVDQKSKVINVKIQSKV